MALHKMFNSFTVPDNNRSNDSTAPPTTAEYYVAYVVACTSRFATSTRIGWSFRKVAVVTRIQQSLVAVRQGSITCDPVYVPYSGLLIIIRILLFRVLY